jgi:hypothetical protein
MLDSAHRDDVGVQEIGCDFLEEALQSCSEDDCHLGAVVDAIASAMHRHPADSRVQRSACAGTEGGKMPQTTMTDHMTCCISSVAGWRVATYLYLCVCMCCGVLASAICNVALVADIDDVAAQTTMARELDAGARQALALGALQALKQHQMSIDCQVSQHHAAMATSSFVKLPNG